MDIPHVHRHWFAVGLLIRIPHNVQVLQPAGGGLDDATVGDESGGIEPLDVGVKVVVDVGIHIGVDGITLVNGIRLVAHEPQGARVSLCDLGNDLPAGTHRHLRRVVRVSTSVEADQLYVGQAVGMGWVEAGGPITVPTSVKQSDVVASQRAAAKAKTIAGVGVGRQEVLTGVQGAQRLVRRCSL